MLRLLWRRSRLHAAAPLRTSGVVTHSTHRSLATTTAKDDGSSAAASSPSSGGTGDSRVGGPSVPSQHPMERLSFVFQHHPSALRLHRELTIALATGDAERAADLAGVLAATVQQVVAAASAVVQDESSGAYTKTPVPENPTSVDDGAAADIPTPTPHDVEAAMEKTREAVAQRAARAPRLDRTVEDDTDQPATATDAERPFWRDPQHLCVTVLESAFETDVPEGEAQDALSAAGNRAAAHEAAQVRILEAYLEKEAQRWKAQKAAVAKIVLDVARSLHVTPADIQSTEGLVLSGGGGAAQGKEGGQRLNVLRHSNLVVRGEVPTNSTSSAAEVQCAIDDELAALQERMTAVGTPLTPEEVLMARHELQMSNSRMRYVVGVHKELQYALDSSESLRQKQKQSRGGAAAASVSGTQLFIDEVIRALNEGSETFSAEAATRGLVLSVQDVHVREAVECPVLPFTFMLKCCLWFDTAATPS